MYLPTWINSGILVFCLVLASPTQAQSEVIPDTTLHNNFKLNSTAVLLLLVR